MSSKQWLALAAWVLMPFAATAQQKQAQHHPTDTNAHVSTIGYASAFKAYRASHDQSETPDTRWRAANAEMGRLGGHAGHMKESAEQEGASAGLTQVPKVSNAMPNQGGAADHSKHH